MFMGYEAIDPKIRFFKRVEKTKTCWNWTGAIWNTKPQPYGCFIIKAKYKVFSIRVKAHRYSYELFKGPIPEGLQIDHLCRNTLCVNPDHLEAVTPKVNTLRGISVSAINARKTHCLNGHLFDEKNTRFHKNKRHCRTCRREWAANFRKNKKHTMEQVR